MLAEAQFHRNAACLRGCDDLAGRGHAADGRKSLRLFSTWEITRYLIPVAQAHFRRVLRQNPALPQGRTETAGGAKWFTLDEVLRLRAHFAAEGSRAKPYAPWRPAGLPAKVVTKAYHLYALPTAGNRLRVAADWAINTISRPIASQLGLVDPARGRLGRAETRRRSRTAS